MEIILDMRCVINKYSQYFNKTQEVGIDVDRHDEEFGVGTSNSNIGLQIACTYTSMYVVIYIVIPRYYLCTVLIPADFFLY